VVLFWITAFFVYIFQLQVTMQLVINGQEKDLQSSGTITQMLKELDITGSHIAVALNFQVVPRSNYDQTPLNEGDKIEIVHAVGGG
jgi:sulfur carrier protein